jgi:hypothetical protein
MSGSEPNPNQQRSIGTHLRLLSEELEAISGPPALDEVLGALNREIAEMRREFALPPDWQPSLARKISAVAEVWIARVEDLRGRRLRGYGEVSAALKARLDPHVDRLAALLRQLAEAARKLE